MSKIYIIDDDFSSESLAEYLSFNGHDATRIATAQRAMDDLEAIAKCDGIIIDVMMERPSCIPEAAAHGGQRTGLYIVRELRKLNPNIPVVIFSGSRDPQVREWAAEKACHFLDKWSDPSLAEVMVKMEESLGIKSKKQLPVPFIVHGRDDATKLEVKNYLQNKLGLPEPIILHEQPSHGRTIIEKFEAFALQSQLAFVVLTPDDPGSSPSASNEEKRRARQNVIFELGYFLGTFGRNSGRVLLLYKGSLELPSDISGVIYIDITNGIESAAETIRRELQHVLK
jgi:predicted nucleotide-binding protein